MPVAPSLIETAVGRGSERGQSPDVASGHLARDLLRFSLIGTESRAAMVGVMANFTTQSTSTNIYLPVPCKVSVHAGKRNRLPGFNGNVLRRLDGRMSQSA